MNTAYYALCKERYGDGVLIFFIDVDSDDVLLVTSQKELRLGFKFYDIIDIVPESEYEKKRGLWENTVCKSVGKQKYIALVEDESRNKRIIELVLNADDVLQEDATIKSGNTKYTILEFKTIEDVRQAYRDWSHLFYSPNA